MTSPVEQDPTEHCERGESWWVETAVCCVGGGSSRSSNLSLGMISKGV